MKPTNRFRHLVVTYLRSAKFAVTMAAFSMIALAATELLRPWPLKIIFDYILLERKPPPSLAAFADFLATQKTMAIVAASAAIVAIAFLRGSFAYWETYHTSRLGSELGFRLRNELFAHVQRLSLAYHLRRRTGEMMTRIAGDTNTVKSFVSDSLLTLGSHTLMIVGTFTVMFFMNWQLALMVLVSFPILVWNIYALHKRSKIASQDQRKREDRIASHVTEVLSSVQLIQAFARERFEQQKFETDNHAALDQSMKSARIESAAARVVELTTAFGTCVVVLFGSLQVLQGEMSPGTILVFSSYLHGLYRPIRRMVKLTIQFSRVQVGVQRITEVLNTNPEIDDRPDAVSPAHVEGEITFDDVSFAYSAEQEDVLRHLSFRIAPGQRVAIVGVSGAGKSTLIGLILRLYDPRCGRILLDGIDLKDLRRESLRGQIAVVLQDSVLLGSTVYENIAYGNPHATRDEVTAAAMAAHAHDFILELEQGYDTIIGERGARLSGGQKRRIAIARALIRNAPILILDEPMSGLDEESERLVEEGLRTLMNGRTCLLITHDLRAAAGADLVIALESGRAILQPACNRSVIEHVAS